MIQQYQSTAEYEYGIRQLHYWEASEILHVDPMAANRQRAQGPGESVDEGEEDLRTDDGVDHAIKNPFCRHGVLFDYLREIVEATGNGEGEE